MFVELLFLAPDTPGGVMRIVILVIFAPAIVYAAANMSYAHRVSQLIGRFLGWMSYPVYCLHFPIGRWVLTVFTRAQWPRWEGDLCAICLTLAASFILALLYDEPVRKTLNRSIARSFVRRA